MINLAEETIDKSDLIALTEWLDKNPRLTKGQETEKFEQEWSDWLGCKHSLFVSSGSTANLLLVAAMKEKYNLKDGDKVIVPAMTWVTNISPIMQLGLQPIFCDVDPITFSFNEHHLKVLALAHHDIKLEIRFMSVITEIP